MTQSGHCRLFPYLHQPERANLQDAPVNWWANEEAGIYWFSRHGAHRRAASSGVVVLGSVLSTGAGFDLNEDVAQPTSARKSFSTLCFSYADRAIDIAIGR